MRQRFLNVVVLAALLLPGTLRAQVVELGLGAGYSLNNEVLREKGASTGILPGYSHGFYVGPQVDFALKNGFSIRTGVNFRKGGSVLRIDAEKLAVNFHQMVEDTPGLVDMEAYLKAHPDLEVEGITSAQMLYYLQQFDQFEEDAIEQLKGTELRSAVDRYSLNIPLLLHYSAGRLGVNAGVNLNVLLFNPIAVKANLPGGLVYSDRDLESILPYVHGTLSGVMPGSSHPEMTPEKFYKEDIARPVALDLQAGVEVAVGERMALQLNVVYGITSSVKAPLSDFFVLHDLAFQAGLVYNFGLRKQ